MRPEEIARRIEHTLLRASATADEIRALCGEALEHGFYSVCVNPWRVGLASGLLRGSGVRVTSVAGFPLGAGPAGSKAGEAAAALGEGADEVDMVMNIGAALDGDWETVGLEITRVLEAMGPAGDAAVLKVIIECCFLDETQKRRAIEAVATAGAHYVKTSTGFGPGGATVEDVALMKEVLGGRARIKAAGGVSTLSRLRDMVEAGADLVGTSSGVSIMKEAGLAPS